MKRVGFRFRRQQVMVGFIVDFYCPAARLVVEVDGVLHAERVEEDRARDAVLEALGLYVLRVTDDQVRHDIDGVVALIFRACAERSG